MPRLPLGAPPKVRTPFAVASETAEPLSLFLWQRLRNVLLWADTPPEHRTRLFRPVDAATREAYAAVVDVAPLLADPLAVLMELRRAPGEADAARVGRACNQVWEWADRCGLKQTAVFYAEAAAHVDATCPAWAVVAGYVTRLAGGPEMLTRSFQWHRRAYGLAVRARNREEHIRALTGMGALLKDLGDSDEARLWYRRAARAAARVGRKRRAAVVTHYAFALSAERGEVDRAVAEAARALSLYPLHDERLPALAHDFSYLLVRCHHYRTAFRVLEAIGERADGLLTLGTVLGLTARAAAGAGRPRRARMAEQAALNVARINDACAGSVYVNLAEAARLTGRLDAAGEYARQALDVAERRDDAELDRLARELVELVERKEPPPLACEPDRDAPAAKLARRMVARLARWKRHGRGVGTAG